MEDLLKIDHKLNLKNRINIIDKYHQFSEENTNSKPEENKKWPDILETILFQLDAQFNLLCLTNNKAEINNYLRTMRSNLMDDFASNDLIKKYNTRAGMSKTNVSVNLTSNDTNQAGVIFYSDYFTINIVLIDRKKKLYHHIKPIDDEYHFLMINVDKEDEEDEEYLPPMSANSYLYKELELIAYLNNFTETKKIADISCIKQNVKNLDNVYRKEITDKKKVTSYKVAELQGMAKANNISITTSEGKKKTKAQLFEEMKDIL
jgi:hypothetical protein